METVSQPDGTLLAQMLRILDGGSLETTDGLARRLGVSEALVAAMAENLVRGGYLVSLEGSCGAGCGDCSLAGACGTLGSAVPSSSRLLALTRKGRQAAHAD
jgi:hypothetical protein